MTKKDPIMVQVVLRDQETSAHLTTWVEKEKLESNGKPIVGGFVKLKEPELENKWYEIATIYDVEVPKSQLGVRGFDNNNYDKHDGTAIKERK